MMPQVNLNLVERLFAHKGIKQPNGWYIFSKVDAIDFVEECRKQGINIFGIDGFFIGKDVSHPGMPDLITDENSIQPSMEHSVDYSETGFKPIKESIYDEATDFLGKQDSGMFFEIVCGK